DILSLHTSFFFHTPPPTAIYPLSLHDALPIFQRHRSDCRATARGKNRGRSAFGRTVEPWCRVHPVPHRKSADRSGVRPEGSRCRSEEHTSELQSRGHLVCRLLLEKKKK